MQLWLGPFMNLKFKQIHKSLKITQANFGISDKLQRLNVSEFHLLFRIIESNSKLSANSWNTNSLQLECKQMVRAHEPSGMHMMNVEVFPSQ